MYSIVQYIGAAAAYEGDYSVSESAEALLGNYSAHAVKTDMNAKAPETDGLKTAIKSVYLDLGATPSFAFRFKTSFSGQVTLSYENVDNVIVSKTITVENGIVEETGTDVYVLSMKAYDMANDIDISISGGGTGSYSVNAYYTQVVSEMDALYDIICALNAYCNAAKAYKA